MVILVHKKTELFKKWTISTQIFTQDRRRMSEEIGSEKSLMGSKYHKTSDF